MTARYEIIDCVQKSAEWYEARRGLPTGSRFSDVLAQGEGKVRGKYLRQLAGEVITGELMENYSNEKMDRGNEQEPVLRSRYAFDKEVDVVKIGFVKMNPELCAVGCSPDGLIGDDGMVEFKSCEPHVLIEIIEKGKFRTTDTAQVQGNLWIMKRQWCDVVYGWAPPEPRPGFDKLPLFVTRVYRDETYMGTLAHALRSFNAELAALVNRLKVM